jgi:S-adenosylmethionine synthetase
MFNNTKIYTVESVTSGHPDKMCDQISDAVLDECLSQDPKSRVAIESFGGHGLLLVGGEVTTNANVNFEELAMKVYRDIGYEDELKIMSNIVCQSPDIAQGVDTGGAGDQGIMYGYATDETKEFLPRGVVLSHKLTKGLESLRKEIPWLKPDGKSQITINDGKIKSILISCQHNEDVSREEIYETIKDKLIEPIMGDISDIEIYGGLIPHGGGCFSGKDPSKVDRSAAYMARFAAKNIVANGFAKECLVSASYAIGRAEPLMVEAVNEKGEDLRELVNKNFDFKPRVIIERLNLLRPIYLKTASYGHFGKEGLPWEEIVEMQP